VELSCTQIAVQHVAVQHFVHTEIQLRRALACTDIDSNDAVTV